MRFLQGFGEIAPDYDGFVLDLWGVVHDGVNPLPGAPDTLLRLHDAGKRTVLLSNAPRRSSVIARQLAKMGIPDHHYSGIMTSGEASHIVLRDRPDSWYRALGDKVFFIGPERDWNIVDGLPLTVAHAPEDATFVLNLGPDHLVDPAEAPSFDPILQRCAARGLKMICANPDLEVIRGGVRVLCAGGLALRYGEMGGDVRLLGKPDPEIYRPIQDMLDLPKPRILAVGDALRTDIAGAAAFGIDSCWVTGGIHGEHLADNPAAIKAEARNAGLSPIATIPAFVW